MRLGIFGIGAIGGLIANRLSGCKPVLFPGPDSIKALDEGLILHDTEGAISWLGPEGFEVGDESTSIDAAIVCTNSNSTLDVAQYCKSVLADNGVALSLQNGLGHAECLARQLGWNRVLAASTIHGAIRVGLNEMRWTGRGDIKLGRMNESSPDRGHHVVEDLIQLLQDAELEPIWMEDMKQVIWSKLMINVAINPLTAITGVKNGSILENPEMMGQADALMTEAMIVARQEGVDLDLDEMRGELRKVLKRTADNKSSMLQDIMSGRATEIDSICGEVIERAERHGIQTPLNNMILAMVKAIQIH